VSYKCAWIDFDGKQGFAFLYERCGTPITYGTGWHFESLSHFRDVFHEAHRHLNSKAYEEAYRPFLDAYVRMMGMRRDRVARIIKRYQQECAVSCGKSAKIRRQKAEIQRLFDLASYNWSTVVQQRGVIGVKQRKIDRQARALTQLRDRGKDHAERFGKMLEMRTAIHHLLADIRARYDMKAGEEFNCPHLRRLDEVVKP